MRESFLDDRGFAAEQRRMREKNDRYMGRRYVTGNRRTVEA